MLGLKLQGTRLEKQIQVFSLPLMFGAGVSGKVQGLDNVVGLHFDDNYFTAEIQDGHSRMLPQEKWLL